MSKRLLFTVGLVLIAQGAGSRLLSISERNLPRPALDQLPRKLGNWRLTGEQTLEKDIVDYLQPEEYVLRDYAEASSGSVVNLFVAYFKSLQNTLGPHSPGVCLPGAGWLVRSMKVLNVDIPGRSAAIPVNQYVLEQSGDQIVVLYWYQNDRNTWAEEFHAKLKLLHDLIRYRRSDVSLVRLIIRTTGTSPERGLSSAVDFTRVVYPALVERFGTTK